MDTDATRHDADTMTREQQAIDLDLDLCGMVMDAVQPKDLEWLWRGRIPLGKLTGIEGDPDLGKSLLTHYLAACVTNRRLPYASPPDAEPVDGGVVFVSGEDDTADTIMPRLAAAGADLSRIFQLKQIPTLDKDSRPMTDPYTGQPVTRVPAFPRDLAYLRAAIDRYGAKLVVIDPLYAHLGDGRTDIYNDKDVRRALTPLAQVAEETGAAIVFVRHLTKGNPAGNPKYRGGGSIGVLGQARSVLVVAQDPDDEEARILALVKGNLGRKESALRYHISDRAVEGVAKPQPYVAFDGTSQHTAWTLSAAGAPDGTNRDVLDAVQALGPRAVTAKDVFDRLVKQRGYDAEDADSYERVRKAMQRLTQPTDGRLVRAGRGEYRAAARLHPGVGDGEGGRAAERASANAAPLPTSPGTPSLSEREMMSHVSCPNVPIRDDGTLGQRDTPRDAGDGERDVAPRDPWQPPASMLQRRVLREQGLPDAYLDTLTQGQASDLIGEMLDASKQNAAAA